MRLFRRSQFRLLCVAAVMALPVGPAAAFQATSSEQTLELADGAALRGAPSFDGAAPRENAAWRRFLARDQGAPWQVLWDRDAGVPRRIYGRGLHTPGSIADPALAEKAARQALADTIDLLAPGASPADFILAGNHLGHGVRTVGFFQVHRGLPVVGGQVSFRFKRDRLIAMGSEAVPNVEVTTLGTLADPTAARVAAERWIGADRAKQVVAGKVKGPMILSVVLASGQRLYQQVLEVTVEAQQPRGRWLVYVDAASGRPFARRQTLLFASQTFAFNVPVRRPGGQHVEQPASRVQATVSGQGLVTGADGTLTWTATQATQASLSVVGPLVAVINAAGARVTTSAPLTDGGRFVWSEASDPLKDSQLITFTSVSLAKEYVRQIEPSFAFLNDQIEASVNQSDTCNAYSDGTSVNFFQGDRNCENTGRLPDVIYHEFGHSVHFHAIVGGAGSFDTSLSEGVSDFLAASMTGDHGMGRGFFYDDRALRDVDPAGSEAMWPRDQAPDPHETGLIIAGAMWDVRKALIGSMGEAAGITYANQLWFGLLERASDIPSSYVEVLISDDDDGDLSNGTPNVCAINAAFEAHGLADRSQVGPSIGAVDVSGMRVILPVGGQGLCPGAEVQGATLIWEVRGAAGSGGQVEMTREPGRFVAALPAQPDGSLLLYRIELHLANGTVVARPDNPADPMYQLFLGGVTPIYCNEFESDPFAAGWSHRLLAGSAREGADDWQWGQPTATDGSGDPGRAHSGQHAVGNDLGGGNFNGLYQSGKTNELRSPPIDVSGYSQVRLQYWRWLGVEDGAFDHAQILANDQVVWSNLGTNAQGSTHHVDREWRFQDVDLSAIAAASADGKVTLSFRLGSDQGLEFGGWTLDDFCVVSTGGPAVCGNNVREAGEQCDDGNQTPADGCEPSCVTTPEARCGDSVVQAGEECDDGNAVAGDGCEATCTRSPAAVCGDSVVQAGEQCDDGNLADGDGCSATCTVSACGNGAVETGEDCDQGASNGGEVCALDCHWAATKLLEDDPSGCGCATVRGGPRSSAWILGLLALLVLRRRPA